MVCFRYIVVNTLHEGDNKDNNDDDDGNNNNNNNNNKVDFTLWPVMKAQSGSRDIAILFLQRRH